LTTAVISATRQCRAWGKLFTIPNLGPRTPRAAWTRHLWLTRWKSVSYFTVFDATAASRHCNDSLVVLLAFSTTEQLAAGADQPRPSKLLFMAILWNRAGHYIFAMRFLLLSFCLSFFLPHLVSAQPLQILPHI